MRLSSTPRRLASAALAGSVLLALPACTGSDPSAAPDPAASPTSQVRELVPGAPGEPVATASGPIDVEVPGWSHADLAFVQMMIPHHRQALEMAALAPERASSTEVLSLARRIDAAQAPEIWLMSQWLAAEGLDVPEAGDDPSEWDHAAHGHAGMAGLLTPEEMAALIRAEGTDFDRLFLEGMIRHHDGAVQMATEGMPESTNARVLELMEEVATGQLAEIARMERLLDQLPA